MYDQKNQSYQSEKTGDQASLKTKLHKEITTEIMTTTTSRRDRKVFEISKAPSSI